MVSRVTYLSAALPPGVTNLASPRWRGIAGAVLLPLMVNIPFTSDDNRCSRRRQNYLIDISLLEGQQSDIAASLRDYSGRHDNNWMQLASLSAAVLQSASGISTDRVLMW